ncbi:unnamed protein product [Ostreobium quekettii]|uniref:Serine aminopeptidase S33 domain-containing protein n=1 Tax=Ostreobium quekettii TaxID=121088 RepID=A0A8S1J7A6_9CHLO|nr:unnamed protein product [Ostreobium quekettii]
MAASSAGPPARSPPAHRSVRFKNRSGESLAGILVDPGSPIAVVLAHGFTLSKDWIHYPVLAERLADRSVGSFRFDFSGHGESEGRFEYGNFWKAVGDVRAAVEWLREEVEKRVVGLIGHSKGGIVAVLYASEFDDIPSVVNISGSFDLKSSVAERFGPDIFERLEECNELEIMHKNEDGKVQFKCILTKQSMDERMSMDMDAAARRIQRTNVLTIHGSADAIIPVAEAHKFSAIRSHDVVIIDGADHNFSNLEHGAALVDKLVEFLMRGA